MSTPRPAEYLIKPKEISPGWVLLYATTFALQFFCASFRAFIAYPALSVFAWLLAIFTGGHVHIPYLHVAALVIGYGPLVLSLLTLVLPIDGWWWEQSEGARRPSERERYVYEDAIQQLKQTNPALREPRRVCVLDIDDENAAAYADTLMITRGMLESPLLAGVIAHELGHLNSSDARLSAALHRLTTPPRGHVRRGLRTICFFATGAAGMWPVRAAWGAYWRHREYEADHYAAALGQGQLLAVFLDERALNDLPVPFVWLTEHTHPPTELRIDRIAHNPA